MFKRTNLKSWLVIIVLLLAVQYSLGPQAWAGSVVGWGYQKIGTDTSNSILIAAGSSFSLALKADGSIVGWGGDGAGQATPPSGNDFVAVSGEWWHGLALKQYRRMGA